MTLYEYDGQIVSETGCISLCGVDEAGRGPLAGPVYAAAVILPHNCGIIGLNDSKKLSEKKRESLFEEITANALTYCVASVTAREIDELNILQASLLAMRKAVGGLSTVPDLILTDGNADPKFGTATRLVIGGDALSACIAAASILAKVSRDRYMLALDEKHPEYGFKKHKGYGTKAHYDALNTYGTCAEHRESFLKKWRASK